MKISISNYNNIDTFNYEIIDNKINFLFAISGSGKSSIARALSTEILEINRNVESSNDNIIVKVNGNDVKKEDYKVFDNEYVNGILINRTNKNDVYSIIIGDKGEIDECRKLYLDSIKSLNNCKDLVYGRLNHINDLYKSLSIRFNNNNKLYKNCKLIKFEENIKQVNNYSVAKSKTVKEINWINEGVNTDYFINNKCPFCNRKISSRKKQQLLNLSKFDAKDFEIINENTLIFDKLNIKMPNWKSKRDVNNFYRKIEECNLIRNELNEIINYIEIIQNYELDIDNLSFKAPSKLLKKHELSIYNAMMELKDNNINIKRKLGKLKAETNKVIGKNIKEINDDLEILGLKYKFEKIEILEENKIADYKIVHINDEKNSDMRNNLSSGEKSIIGLLFFLLANINGKYLIIDDPASSYDEYRRKVMFDLIFKYHAKSTVLVLSHDHVFAKYALFCYEHASKKKDSDLYYLKRKYLTDTGKIDYLESYNKFEIKNIKREDFGNIEEFIKENISTLGDTMNYRVAINLRLLFELSKVKSKDVYGYLSAIMHKTPYGEIMKLLEEKGISEDDILFIIKNKTEYNYKHLREDYLKEIEDNDYSNFERLILMRENLNKKIKKERVLYDELSNIIHLNNAYAICLNPYKYNYFSRYVYNYIRKNEKE